MEGKVFAGAQHSKRVGRLQAHQSHLNSPAGTLLQPPLPGLGLENTAKDTSETHFSGPACSAAQARRFVVGSPGELGGRAWENMGEIEPAKRNEKHISGCEGKRMWRHNP